MKYTFIIPPNFTGILVNQIHCWIYTKTLATKGISFLSISTRPMAKEEQNLKWSMQLVSGWKNRRQQRCQLAPFMHQLGLLCFWRVFSLVPTQPAHSHWTWSTKKQNTLWASKQNRVGETWWTTDQLYLKLLCSEMIFQTSSHFIFAYLLRGICCSFHMKDKGLLGMGGSF